jgi:hypothetical protein
MVLYVGDVCVHPFDDALLCFLQRACDADLLVDRYVDLLLGDPAVLMFQDVECGLSVAGRGCVVQRLGGGKLAVGAAFQFCKLN